MSDPEKAERGDCLALERLASCGPAPAAAMAALRARDLRSLADLLSTGEADKPGHWANRPLDQAGNSLWEAVLQLPPGDRSVYMSIVLSA